MYLKIGIVDKRQIFQWMQEFTTGSNRAKKATIYIAQILTRQNKILQLYAKLLKSTPYDSLNQDERKALCLCLICLTYPITYNLLIALAQGFKAQNQINKKFINEKVMSIYGSNRTVDVAIDALLPMIIELNTIKRDKVSIYSFGQKTSIKNQFVAELIIYTDIVLSGTKTILIDDLSYKPWFAYFDISIFNPKNFCVFINKKDSSIGQGYLSI